MLNEPRILVISHNAFSQVYNNGKTLESIFWGNKKENLAHLFFNSNELPDFNFCDNYFKITDKDVLKRFLRFSKTCGGIELKASTSGISKEDNELKAFFKKRSNQLSLFRDILWKTRTWESGRLIKWAVDFKPDIIFYMGGNLGFSHEISLFLSKKLNKPLFVYFTDDYIIYPKTKNIFEYIQKLRARKFYRKTVEHASECFAIGQIMCDEYSEYFKKRFRPIMNTQNIEPLNKKGILKNEINISFIGGLHLKRWEMLIEIAGILNEVRDLLKYKCNLLVFSSTKLTNKIKKKFKETGIEFKGCVTGVKLLNAFRESQILLHVESSDVYYKSLTRLSISTKIPEYLLSGNCILAYGPIEIASMKLLSENKIGCVIDNNESIQNKKIKIIELINSECLRNELSMNGYDYAAVVYNGENVRKEFKRILYKYLNE